MHVLENAYKICILEEFVYKNDCVEDSGVKWDGMKN